VKPARVAAVAAALLAFAAGGYYVADRAYLTPAGDKAEQIAELADRVERFDAALRRGRETRDRWREIRATTIASTDQDAAHRVRTLVSKIGADAGLIEVVVNHGRPSIAGNPAAERRSRVPRALRNALEDREDFRVLRGTLRGSGTLDQLATAAVTLSSQPWAHRIESLAVEPADRERTRFDLSIAFATLYTVDAPAVPTPELSPPDPARLEEVLGIARTNPFVLPPPPTPPPQPAPAPEPEPAPAAEPAPPPPPPFDRWRVTGVVERSSPGGGALVEVFLRRTDTGETRVLRAGDQILGLALAGADTRRVTFREGDRLVAVDVGRALNTRSNAE